AAQCHHAIFYRGGMPAEHRTASIRHAQAAIAYGQDDALALSFAGFVIAMDKRDRAAAFTAFDAALAISPSLALAYHCSRHSVTARPSPGWAAHRRSPLH